MSNISQEDFLEEFANLIKVFSKLISSSENNLDNLDKLDRILNVLLEDSPSSFSSSNPSGGRPYNEEETQETFDCFMVSFSKVVFNHNIIPYDKITECVFKNTPEEILDEFTNSLRALGSDYFSNKNNTNEHDKEKDFFRIMRHIDLALVQKYNFINMKLKKIEDMTTDMKNLMEDIHSLKSDYTNLKRDYTELEEKANEQNKAMLGQFISILGIFSAVLMGSFGAIQGFTSLFNNAYLLSIGELLIISSVGGASVILILFYLLTSIAKLIGKNLKSTDYANATLIEKYSSLFIIFGILGLISMVGAALLLSNINLYFSWSGLWWLLPLIWFIYFAWSFHKKSLFPFFKK